MLKFKRITIQILKNQTTKIRLLFYEKINNFYLIKSFKF